MIFDIFKKNKKEYGWINLSNLIQLDEIMSASNSKPQIIFKHSTRCSISIMAKSRLEENIDLLHQSTDIYYLDLLKYRNISNEITDRWQIEHESPQVIVIKNGLATYHQSHNMIAIDEILRNI